MNKLKYLTAILIAIAGLGLQQAQAHLLDPDQFFHSGPIGNPTNELNHLQNNGGPFLPATSKFLFKKNNNGSTDGDFGDFFTVSMTTGNSWDISWKLAGSGFGFDGVLIKDGNVQGSGMLYRFYGVSADEKFVGSGTVTFDDPVKNISHIGFFGSPGSPTQHGVPDGGTTVMLLGGALSVLGMARRYVKG
jgi:hypothetical protein